RTREPVSAAEQAVRCTTQSLAPRQMEQNTELETLIDGLSFPEAPRWHDGKLWFSDFYSLGVLAVDLRGNATTVVEVPERPSGLGWRPDGTLLIVSMRDRSLYRLDAHQLVRVADLSAMTSGLCNDMVVDAQGRAYVGNFGYDRHAGEAP